MAWFDVPKKTAGEMITHTEFIDLSRNVVELGKRVGSPYALSTPLTQTVSITNLTTNVLTNWAIPASTEQTLVLSPQLKTSAQRPRFLVILSGFLTVVSNNATATIAQMDLFGNNSGSYVAPSSATLGLYQCRAALNGSTIQETFRINIMRIYQHDDTQQNWRVFPAVRLVQLGGTPSVTFNGTMWYKEI